MTPDGQIVLPQPEVASFSLSGSEEFLSSPNAPSSSPPVAPSERGGETEGDRPKGWLKPLGIAGGVAVLAFAAAYFFISRRPKSPARSQASGLADQPEIGGGFR